MSRNVSMTIRTDAVYVMMVVLLLFLVGRNVAAATYSYSLDRFEVSGNRPISARDEFDNGIVSPWSVYAPR